MKTRKFKILVSVLFFLGLTVMIPGRAKALDPCPTCVLLPPLTYAINYFEAQLEEFQKVGGILKSCVPCTTQGSNWNSGGPTHGTTVCDEVKKKELHDGLLKEAKYYIGELIKKPSDSDIWFKDFGDRVEAILKDNNYTCEDKESALAELNNLFSLTYLSYLLSPANPSDKNNNSPRVSQEVLQAPKFEMVQPQVPQGNPAETPQPITPNVVTANPVTYDSQPTSHEVSELQGPGPQFVKFGSMIGGGCSIGTRTEGGADVWMLGLFLILPLFARILRKDKPLPLS